ncbi:MAG: PilZ domain-containing protein [Alphaproteobacteria bacterium]|nr:PilZ domain-containing protein [Alphaproteobacteria bacterium]
MPRNRRLYRRIPLPAELEVAGLACTLIDLSVGGFAAANAPPLEPNTPVEVGLRLAIDGIEVGARLNARILYVSHGRSAGKFVELSASQTAFLRYLVTWRGASVGAVGATTLLDAITGGAALERDSTAGFGRRPRRAWWAGLSGKTGAGQ